MHKPYNTHSASPVSFAALSLDKGVGISDRTKAGILEERKRLIKADPVKKTTQKELKTAFEAMAVIVPNYSMDEIARRATKSLREAGNEFTVSGENLSQIMAVHANPNALGNKIKSSLTDSAAVQVANHMTTVMAALAMKRARESGTHLG